MSDNSCTGKGLWHKLHADDLVLVTTHHHHHHHLESLLAALAEVSARYNLKINPKKSAIFAVKNHDKLTKREFDLRDIPIVSEYCYLGVTIDNRGSIAPHVDRVKRRSAYLRSQMRYYARHLSFEN